MSEHMASGSPINGGRVSFRRVGHRNFIPKDAPVIKSHSPLSWFERWFYFAGWVTSVACTCYKVYQASLDKDEMLNDYDFSSGWKWLGRKKDMSNFEWMFWYEWELEMWPWLVGHVVIGQVVRLSNRLYKRRALIFLIYSIFANCFIMTPSVVTMLCVHCLLVYIASLTASAVVVWIVSLLLLSTLNFSPGTQLIRELSGEDPYDAMYYLTMFTTAMFQLRYTSGALDMVSAKQKLKSSEDTEQNKTVPDYNMLDLFSYAFYLPLFFTGPIITFDEFYQQFNQPMGDWTKLQLLSILKDSLRVLFWVFFIEFSLHYFYFNSMQRNSYMMNEMSLWALAGLVFCQGQFFQVKYVVMFGIPRNIARFDFIDPPLGPKCISRIYLYSQMWKYFDRGLHAFLKKHIYIPLGGSRVGVLRQCLASALCFTFVYYWHGAEDYLAVWCLLNFIGITCEVIGNKLSAMPSIQEFENSKLSLAMSRRLRAALCVPFFTMSIVAIFCFFAGLTATGILVNRLLLSGGIVPVFTIFISLYCCVQTAMEIEKEEFRKNNYKRD